MSQTNLGVLESEPDDEIPLQLSASYEVFWCVHVLVQSAIHKQIKMKPMGRWLEG